MRRNSTDAALAAMIVGLAVPAAAHGVTVDRNELLITDLVEGGSIKIFEYRAGGYREIWSTVTPRVEVYRGGAEAGDLTGDGIAEIALAVSEQGGPHRLEIWSYAGASSWELAWSEELPSQQGTLGGWHVGDILDVDADGTSELLVTNQSLGRLELYSHDGAGGFSVETIVRQCNEARFIATAGDLDGDGTPEILFQCTRGDDLVIQEHSAGAYPVVGSIRLPPGLPAGSESFSMFVDDMETGDVNGDGRADAVFCGNSGRVHVVTFDAATRRYVLEYSSPEPARTSSFSQTCSVGDVTNDGQADLLVVTQDGAVVYSHQGSSYVEVWRAPAAPPPIGTSFIGDADDDGLGELLFGNALEDRIVLYESDLAGATALDDTFSFSPLTFGGGSILVADLKPDGDDEPGSPGPTEPDAPSDLTANALSPTSVRLTWKDNARDEDGYRVERREGSAKFSEVLALPAGTAEVLVAGLAPGRRYTFRVRAVRGGLFSAYSNRATVDTPGSGAPPAVPAAVSAEAVSATSVRLHWTGVGPETTIHVELRSPFAGYAEAAEAPGEQSEVLVTAMTPDTPYTFRLFSRNLAGTSPYTAEVHATTLGVEGPCRNDGAHLCLLGGRFEVGARFRIPQSPFTHGLGTAIEVPGSQETGMFWFFAPGNVELVVKMLDGATINGRFWLFYGALSDVEYWISVRDTVDGRRRTYHNPPKEICGGADTQAFVHGGLASSVESSVGALVDERSDPGPCEESETALCFGDGRFEVTVEWSNPRQEGHAGSGRAVPGLDTGETGFFWFFDPANVELAVKVLDGRAVNGNFWFFWGALSDVEYTIRLRDTLTQAIATYHNEPFSICGGADIDPFSTVDRHTHGRKP
jgi:hypothetical protein